MNHIQKLSKQALKFTITFSMVMTSIAPYTLANQSANQGSYRNPNEAPVNMTSVLSQSRSNQSANGNYKNPNEAQVNVDVNLDGKSYKTEPFFNIKNFKPTMPSFLKELREEMKTLEMASSQQRANMPVMSRTIRYFPVDSLAFFIAIGNVTYLELLLKYDANPLKMVEHIEAQKDPIAHLSFFMFMLSQGIYMDYKTKGLDPEEKARKMQLLNYKGMAIGSFASTLTSDVLTLLESCSKHWTNSNPKTNTLQLEKASNAQLMQRAQNIEAEKACDQAFSQWTARKKFVQYVPQIISLMASQMVADGLVALKRSVFPGAQQQHGTGSYATKSTQEAAKKTVLELNKLKELKQTGSKAVAAIEVAGVFVETAITPGGKILPKILNFAVNGVFTFTVFVGIDSFVTPHIFRFMKNIFMPAFFTSNVKEIDELLKKLKSANWNPEKMSYDPETCMQMGRGRNTLKCRKNDRFGLEFYDFADQMQAWRSQLNYQNEESILGWLKNIEQTTYQIIYAKKFYKDFINENAQTSYRQNAIASKKLQADVPPWYEFTKFPYRQLPMYGVVPTQFKILNPHAQEHLQRYQFENQPIEKLENYKFQDWYIMRPAKIERIQSAFVKIKTQEFIDAMLWNKGDFKIKNNSASFFAKLLYNNNFLPYFKMLTSENVYEQASGILKLNEFAHKFNKKIDEMPQGAKPALSMHQILVRDFLETLGNPQPLVNPAVAYSYAYEAQSQNKETGEKALFQSYWSNKTGLKKPTDIMLYYSICGSNGAQVDRGVLTGITVSIPRIARFNTQQVPLCLNKPTQEDLYEKPIQVNGVKYVNAYDLLYRNLRAEVRPDYKDTNFAIQTDKFNDWWKKTNIPQYKKYFSEENNRYSTLIKNVDRYYYHSIEYSPIKWMKAKLGLETNDIQYKDMVNASIDAITYPITAIKNLFGETKENTLDLKIKNTFYYELNLYMTALENYLSYKNSNQNELNFDSIRKNALRLEKYTFDEITALEQILNQYSPFFEKFSENVPVMGEVSLLEDFATKNFPLIMDDMTEFLKSKKAKLTQSEYLKLENSFNNEMQKFQTSFKHLRLQLLKFQYVSLLNMYDKGNIDFKNFIQLKKDISKNKDKLFIDIGNYNILDLKKYVKNNTEDTSLKSPNDVLKLSLYLALNKYEEDLFKFVNFKTDIINKISSEAFEEQYAD